MVSTHEVIRMPGTESIEFKPEEMKAQAEKILTMALEAYGKRKAENREIYIPSHVSDCMIGFSTE